MKVGRQRDSPKSQGIKRMEGKVPLNLSWLKHKLMKREKALIRQSVAIRAWSLSTIERVWESTRTQRSTFWTFLSERILFKPKIKLTFFSSRLISHLTIAGSQEIPQFRVVTLYWIRLMIWSLASSNLGLSLQGTEDSSLGWLALWWRINLTLLRLS